MKAWWFSEGYSLPNGDGRKIAVGVTHKIEGPVIPCRNGLHASKNALDALWFAPGPIVWRVELGGEIVSHENDKHAASERTYLAGGVDASETLCKFARLCALDVIHLWDAPDVVVEYLKTGDGDLRYSAWKAARAVSAAWVAVSAASAASAAWVAAGGASVARAARGAASAAEGDATWEKQNRRLTAMLTRLIKEHGG